MIKSKFVELRSVAQKQDSKFVDFGGRMLFITVLEGLLREKGVTASKMLADLGMNKSSVLNWKTRGTVPSGATLQKIADYFGVSVDYLLGKTEQKEKPAEDGGLGENIVRFLGRDGKVLEKKLTPELLAYLESIPDSDDKL